MKLPSLESLWRDIQKVILRFPLQVLVTLLANLIFFSLIDFKGNFVDQAKLMKILALCNFALVLLLAADLYAEVNLLPPVKKWGLRLLCLLICIALYFMLQPAIQMADRFRIGLLAFSFHLLVAFAPFIEKGNLHGFWEYNKVLFLRILTAGLYAAVLFAGLSIALVAINGLFNVKIDENVYLRLFSVVGITFTTLFFLAGVPADFKMINETQQEYPKGLKIFTQYVLIPLLTIYLVILLVYEAKIIIDWELPKGMVSMLVLGYSVFGVLSLLLVYPIKEQEGNGWIRWFSRCFYLMMIPLVVLLLLAVWKRVGNYGITESRYILIILALWLSIITAYFLISRKDNIKIIPISLCILALLATYGPQSAFSVSRYSQTQRLRKMLKSQDAHALKERPQIIRYLVLNHGLDALQPFTKVNVQALSEAMEQQAVRLKTAPYQLENNMVDTAYVLLKVNKPAFNQRTGFLILKAAEPEVMNVKGFDYAVRVQSYAAKFEGAVNGSPLKIEKINQTQFAVRIADEPALHIDIKAVVAAAKRKGELPADGLKINVNGNGHVLTLVITELTFSEDPEEENDLSFKAYLLMKLK
jgi:hypothetical protein